MPGALQASHVSLLLERISHQSEPENHTHSVFLQWLWEQEDLSLIISESSSNLHNGLTLICSRSFPWDLG